MRKKKILIDGVALLSPLTGIGRYTYENAKRLKENHSDKYRFYFNYGHHSTDIYTPKTKNKKDIFVKSIKDLSSHFKFTKKVTRWIFRQISKMQQRTYDLYWQPNFIPIEHIKAKKVIATVHDFSFMLQPQWHPQERLDYFNTYFFKNLENVDHIITGSNFSKNEIINYLDVPAEKVTVIYHAADTKLYKVYPGEQILDTQKKLDLPNEFILFVGSVEPRKNLLRLIKAFNMLNPQTKKSHPLVIVGFKGWENKEIMQEIEKSKEFVHYVGYVSDQELAHIYNLAYIFVYPSLYEGFGIPPIEAMNCATPVIVSSVSSLPEVCEDAALYVDPLSEEEIYKAIKNLVSSQSIYESLIQAGLKRASYFSWEKASLEHLKVFENILNEKE